MRWKMALAQHPMYLLIREDTQCAERTPPWGAPTIADYIDRVRQNLASLERYPHLKLGYEWSGIELELLAQDAPDVLEQMRDYAQESRVQFYNGTYAQPHLQILSSEANLRQFEFGLDTYRAYGLGRVLAYVHQEASVHEQVPQLLKAFGYKFAAVPGFLSTLIWLDEGELVLHGVRGPRFVQGEEFAAWQGLDGTQIPLYLHQPIPREMSLAETLAREEVIGQQSVPPVLIDMPDMIPITPEWMNERKAVEFVLLNEALAERLMHNPARARARLFTHWSYLQGIRVEELARTNLGAERSTLRAEAFQALAFTLLGRQPEPTCQLWKTILTCQHHDVHCFSAPELREKSIGRLLEVQHLAQRIIQDAGEVVAENIDTRALAGECQVFFNSLPHSIDGIAEVTAHAGISAVEDHQGKPVMVETISLENDHNLLRFPVHLSGLGYTTYTLKRGEEPCTWSEMKETLEFENSFFQAIVTPDGVFTSLKLQPDKFELLDGGRGGGNQLTSTDSQAISLKQEDTQARLNRLNSDPTVRGPALQWKIDFPSRIMHSSLGVSLLASGWMGKSIGAQLLLRFYNDLPRIDMTWTFNFQQASVGTFFDDDSKLLTRWPFAFDVEVFHDIPFGVVRTRQDRPFFPISWVDICDGRRGVAFFHQGTPKHWVNEDTLVNLFAWGEDTDAIHNGLGHNRWLKSFDQRLNGSHRIDSAVYVHTGNWRTGAVAEAALAYNFPPVSISTQSHIGSLPLRTEVLQIADPGLISTAVFTRGEQVVCRAYAAGEESAHGSTHLKGLRREGFNSIAGEEVSILAPYQIGELLFGREGL